MVNENPSRDNPSRQQNAERTQGSVQQGPGSARGTGQGSSSSSGAGARGSVRQADTHRDAELQRSGQASGNAAQSGRRQQSGGALETRRNSSPTSPGYGYPGQGSGPFSVMRRISDEMDRLFETFGMGRNVFAGGSAQQGMWDAGDSGDDLPSMWSPHVELCERNGKLLIHADLPGMKRDDINVRIEHDQVILEGERRQEHSDQQGGYYRSERSYGTFYRAIPLPDGTDSDSANATFRDGVLTIEFDAPRQAQRGRRLEIRDAAEPSPSGGSAGVGSGSNYAGATTSAPAQGAPGRTSFAGHSPASGAAASQQSASGTGASQQASGAGTTYSGSGNPSAGAGANETRGGSAAHGSERPSGARSKDSAS